MIKLLSAMSAAAVLAFGGAAAQAECFDAHSVSAQAQQTKQSVALSTNAGPMQALTIENENRAADAVQTCADGEKDCTPGTE